MQDFKRLKVWQAAKVLTVDVAATLPARACRSLPGFRGQVIRAACSVPANIAEGCGKTSAPDFLRHLAMSLGSLLELESHLEVAFGLGALPAERYVRLMSQITTVRRMLINFIKTLRDRAEQGLHGDPDESSDQSPRHDGTP